MTCRQTILCASMKYWNYKQNTKQTSKGCLKEQKSYRLDPGLPIVGKILMSFSYNGNQYILFYVWLKTTA